MPTENYMYLNATGEVRYNMTNDYMFRMVIQKDKETLIQLLCSLLQYQRSEVIDAKIENPVQPGETINDKEYQLDVLVSLANGTFINLEMQVVNYGNWPMRSLAYLCRRFDNTARGEDYDNIKPVYHIGFLDFTLFEDHPEFFAKYQMLNVKDQHLYTDKFNLFVIELNHTNLATDEDKKNNVDTWARLFKAKTWEEIKMITKNNPSMNSTAETIYSSNADFLIAEQCRVREDNIAHEEHMNKKLKEKDATIADQSAAIADLNATIANQNAELQKYIDKYGKLD